MLLVGVGDAEPGKRANLARLHFGCVGIVEMIVTEEMERAVHQEVRRMVFKKHAFFFSLGFGTIQSL